jgi:ABC-type glutathione transport system ATPase component
MSTHQKTLKSLTEVKTLSSHITSLGKIKNASEDERLNGAIDNLIRDLQFTHANGKHKSTPVALSSGTSPEVQGIINYCKQVVGSKKPEWQILAERHGWTPPKA